MTIKLRTDKKRQVVDITPLVESQLEGSGLASILVKHTTAALTLADLDPGTDQDLLDALETMTPRLAWRHPHDPNHFPDHLWSALIGSSLVLPYIGGQLNLGTWQRVVLIELNGPQQREIELIGLKT